MIESYTAGAAQACATLRRTRGRGSSSSLWRLYTMNAQHPTQHTHMKVIIIVATFMAIILATNSLFVCRFIVYAGLATGLGVSVGVGEEVAVKVLVAVDSALAEG